MKHLYYNRVLVDKLTFKEAFNIGRFITNNDCGGFITKNKQGKLVSILVSGKIVQLNNITNKDDRIWKTLSISFEGYQLLSENNII